MYLPKRVVIVEDEMMAQRYLKDILSYMDIIDVHCFTNAYDTIKWIHANDCDMLLLDINIKGDMNGIEMAKTISRNHDIPIVFITAYTDSETVNSALSTSPYGYIEKPFSKSEILLSIKVAYQRFMTYSRDSNTVDDMTNNITLTKDMVYSLKNKTLYKKGVLQNISHKQSELLMMLCKNKNSIVSIDALEHGLWKNEEHADSSLRTLVYSLRKLIPDLNIITHSKVGYSIEKMM